MRFQANLFTRTRASLKFINRQWQKTVSHRYQENRGSRYTETIDLRRTFAYGDAGVEAKMWAKITGNLSRASMPLTESPHVKFLEQYRVIGDKIFLKKHFRESAYFKNAAQCVKIAEHYFGQRTFDGIAGQARAFISLYERMLKGDLLEVRYPLTEGHSAPRSLPVVRETWTPTTFQVDDGMHRLAIMWMLGHRQTKAEILPPKMPTALQYLAAKVGRVQARKGLYQPIDGPEFDNSCKCHRRCHDRLEKILGFLSLGSYNFADLSIVDLGCSYGWFVAEFLKRGADAIGVDINHAALKIGQIAYRLPAGKVVKSNLLSFLDCQDRTYDVVLLLSVLHHFALRPDFGSLEEVLKRADAVTGNELFIDTGQAHEERYRNTLPQWNTDFIVNFVKQHTSFDRVIPLGVDSDGVGLLKRNFGRMLFACVRS